MPTTIRGRVAHSHERDEAAAAICAILVAMVNQSRRDIQVATKLGAAASPFVQVQAQQAAEFIAAMEAWAS